MFGNISDAPIEIFLLVDILIYVMADTINQSNFMFHQISTRMW